MDDHDLDLIDADDELSQPEYEIAAAIHKVDGGYIATVQRQFGYLVDAEKWIESVEPRI